MTGAAGRRLRLGAFLFCVLFNLAGWCSPRFSDLYTAHIFPIWGQTLGRAMSAFPFSVGEWAILFGLGWLAVLLVRCVVALLQSWREGGPRGSGHDAGDSFSRRFCRHMGRLPGRTLDLLLGVAVVMSLNCFILYHCSPLDAGAKSRSYSQAELAALRDMLVEECNDRAAALPRDAAGDPVFAGAPEEEARAAVRALGERLLLRLHGYSVRPKTFFFSDFVSQQHMMGYYFPFTMEANINGRMEPLNWPFTMCHELAHTHGYIFEDEANLIGYLACLSSEDPVFVYSGYLGVLPYVDSDFFASVGREAYGTHPAISDQVRLDRRFLSEESWAEVERGALLDTELVHRAANTFIDQNQKLNGVSAGRAVYSQVVGLLLSYYAGDASYISREK